MVLLGAALTSCLVCHVHLLLHGLDASCLVASNSKDGIVVLCIILLLVVVGIDAVSIHSTINGLLLRDLNLIVFGMDLFLHSVDRQFNIELLLGFSHKSESDANTSDS